VSRLVVVLWLLGLVAIGALPAAAQEEQPTDDEVNAIAKRLYCPVCENVPLDVCPTLACKQWRETIREKLALGWSQAQIEQYFVDQYGDRVLATPPARGLNWAVYLIPPLVFLAGGAVLVGAMRTWRRPVAQPAETAPAAGEDPYLARVEEELRERS
jgi:cytochrome c-type biogenesis protein CcmH